MAAKVSYAEAVEQSIICFNSRITPMFEGHSGIGKSALHNEIKKRYAEIHKETNGRLGYTDVKTVTIFGSLLKEGELGGIPESVEDAELGYDRMGRAIRVNEYTIFGAIRDVLQYSKDVGPDGLVILFVDELNRCDPATQNELMQLVLDYRVNNINMPDNVRIMCAINPDDAASDGLDYNVTTMNEALVARFAYYVLESDHLTWLRWAMRPSSNIDSDIQEYIAENTGALHQIKCKDRMKPNPRNWAQFNAMYQGIKALGLADPMPHIHTACESKLGLAQARSFTEYLKTRSNPLIKPEAILGMGAKGKEADDANLIKKLHDEPVPRAQLTLNNVIKHMSVKLSQKGFKAEWPGNLVKALNAVKNTDAVFSAIQGLNEDYPNLLDKMCEDDGFVEYFTTRMAMASRIK